MISLNLNARDRIKLPASEFPTRADVYTCDKCGWDITKHFHPVRAHVWAAMGPDKYVCRCGEKYLTGATEWDYFSERERRKRVGDTFGLGLVFSAMISVLSVVVYLVLHFVFHRSREAFAIAFFITAFPFFLMVVPFGIEVAASVWRTRVGADIAPGRK